MTPIDPTTTGAAGGWIVPSDPRDFGDFVDIGKPGLAPAPRSRVGGKAFHLGELVRLGQPVPRFFTVSTDAFRHAVAAAGLDGPLGGDGNDDVSGDDDDRHDALDRHAEARRRALLEAPLPDGLEAALARALDGLAGGSSSGPVAVRSSAVGEDHADASFAGLHDSFLFVRGPEAVAAALRRVWASVLNPRALAYRRRRGEPLATRPLADLAVAVVVQEMVEATASGVVFTADPQRGDVYRMVVSSLWGAGEGLVGVGLDADTFIVDKEHFRRDGDAEERPGAVEETVVVKEEMLVLDPERPGGGLQRVAVPAGRREAPSLEPDQLAAVAEAALVIERHFGRPQDIEFSIDAAGRLHVLQARPVTTVEELGPAAGHPLLWDNSNIIESYSGVTSAMTFSFIRRAYAIVYHCFCEVMGIAPEVIRRHRPVFETMLGLFRGRVYYNLANWYRLVKLFPGYELNRSFLESMMGVSESIDPLAGPGSGPDGGSEDDPETVGKNTAPGLGRRLFREGPALVRLVSRTLWNFARLGPIVARFEDHFERCYGRWSALDMGSMAPHELLELYREMEDELLWRWKAPIINDFYVMIFYGLLRTLCERWCGDEAGTLQNDLVCGEGGIVSTEPTRRLLELAAEARGEPALRRLLLDTPPDEALAALAREAESDPAIAAFRASIDEYLELWGFRCVDELKLEVPSLRDRPGFLFQMLANYLRRDEPLDPGASFERERRIRREAEERAFSHLGPLRRLVFRRVLAAARRGVKNRENLRFARTKIYGLVRELLHAVGDHLAAEGILERREDVFHLTLDEVWSYVQGTAVTTDLQALADLRRGQFDAWRDDEPRPADRFRTWGLPYHRNRFEARPEPAGADAADGDDEDGILRGTGCCPGRVEGPVKVLASPTDDARLDGEILVAERTDPGWVPLYPTVSGLAIERGSILSHSAIVAREMGLPTVVGVPGLRRRLETGQRVILDGAAGTVEILDGDGLEIEDDTEAKDEPDAKGDPETKGETP